MCGCLSCAPYWGPGPQPRHVPWLGIELAALWFTGLRSIHWAPPARPGLYFLINFLFWNNNGLTGSCKKYREVLCALSTPPLMGASYITDIKARAPTLAWSTDHFQVAPASMCTLCVHVWAHAPVNFYVIFSHVTATIIKTQIQSIFLMLPFDNHSLPLSPLPILTVLYQ